jgi:hypothetical protein
MMGWLVVDHRQRRDVDGHGVSVSFVQPSGGKSCPEESPSSSDILHVLSMD